MRSNFFLKILAIAFSITAIGGCKNKDAIGPAASPTSSGQNYKCVPIPAGNVKWTYEECGPFTGGRPVDIRQSTQGDVPSGAGFIKSAISNYPPLNKGRLTFTITNLDWTDYPYPEDDIVIALFMAESASMRETNWHILGSREGLDGKVWTRMIAQRFDGLCLPYDLYPCERKFNESDMPRYSRSKSYKFDCQWDATIDSGLFGAGVKDGKVQCDIYDVTDPNREMIILDYKVPSGGPYDHLNYVCVGGGCASMLHKTSVPTRLTNFRLTLFKE